MKELLKPEALLNILEDLKETGDELKAQKEWSESLVQLAPNLIIGLGKDSEILLFNAFAEKVTGYRADEVLGKRWIDLFIPERLHKEIKKLWGGLVISKKARQHHENPVVTKSGKERLMSWNNCVLREDGDFKMILSIGEDITDEREAEKKIRESEDKFRSLYASMREGVCLHEIIYNKTGKAIDYRVLDVNPAYEGLTGIRKAKAIGKRASRLYGTQKPPYLKLYTNVVATGKSTSFETYFEPMKKHFSISATPMGAGHFATVFSDITQVKLAEKRIKKQNEELRASEKELKAINEALKSSEDAYKTVLENTGSAMLIIEKDMTISLVNRSFEKLSGFKKEEIEGKKKWTEFIDAPFVKQLKDYHRARRRRGGKAPTSYEFDFKDRKGKKTRVFLLARLIPGTKKSVASMTDITERKKAEAELEESEKRYRTIVEGTVDMIYSFDKEGTITFISPQVRDYGYSQRDVIGHKIFDFIHPEDLKNVLADFENVVRNGEGSTTELRIKTKEGKWIYAEERSKAMRDNKGKIIGFIGVIRDVTDRKNAEIRLQKSEERFKSIVEASTDGILVADIKTRKFKIANPAICKILGYSREELLRLGVDDIHPKKDLPYVKKQFIKQAKREIIVAENMPCLRKDGSVIYADIGSSPMELEGKNYNVGFFRDITERKKAEAAVKESLKEVRCLYNVVDAIRSESSLEELLLYASGELKKAWQYPEVAGSTILLDGREFGCCRCKNPKNRQTAKIEANGKKRGEVRVCYLKKMPKADEGPFLKEERMLIDEVAKSLGQYIEKVENEKRRFKAEQDLRTAYTQLKELEVMKDEFINMSTHELRTPLVPVIGYLSMLLEEKGLSAGHKEKIEIALTAAQREGKLVDDILDVSKLESERMKFEMVETDISKLINEIVKELKTDARKKGISLHVKISKGLPTINADPKRIMQVLTNLVNNAIKFTEKGSVKVIAKRNNGCIRVCVKDTGIGIPKEAMKYLFTKFYQVDNPVTRKHGGTGLGLAISKKIVEKHGGKIGLQSAPGKGSLFYFELPVNGNKNGKANPGE